MRKPEPCFALLWIATAACTSWHAPDARERARILAASARHGGVVAVSAEVQIESERLHGTFSGVLVSDPGGRVRVQLFPDVGGKILDLEADRDFVAGTIPQAGIRIEGDTRSGALPRHLLTFFAITLLEAATPLLPDRVVAVRAQGSGLVVQVRPLVTGSEVSVELDAHGRVVARAFRYRHVAWQERPGETTEVLGSGFRLLARESERTALDPDEAAAAFSRRP